MYILKADVANVLFFPRYLPLTQKRLREEGECSHVDTFTCKYPLSVQNIRNTFLICSCTPLLPSEKPQFDGHGLYKVLKALHRDAGPCWLQCLPQLCQVDWMSFGWCNILDTHWKLLGIKKTAALQFLTQTGASTTRPRSKTLTSFVWPIHPLIGTQTQSMSHPHWLKWI
jgi:hypothetical protein